MKFESKVIHAGLSPDSTTGAVMTPIYQTSTYIQDGVGNHKGYAYSRTSNPTRKALEDNIAALENGKYGLAFGSGMAAIDAIIKMLNPGDEVISTNDLYGGSYRIFTTVFQNYGIKFHFVDLRNTQKVESLINKNTKLIWAETPTNPTLGIIDIKSLADVSKQNKLILCVDNTFATPYLQNPLDLGADIVMHSATKYICGHSDVVMGLLVVKDNEEIAKELYRIQNTCGAICGPQDAFLALRGIKTLHVRMQRHCENGTEIAKYLISNPKVKKVNWPGLTSHPNHDIAKKQMKDFGGMISFSLIKDTKEEALAVLKRMHLFSLAESLGGVESLASYPALMTHAAIPKEEREKIGITDSLIRLSVGIEHIDDLIEDLEKSIT